MIQAKLLLPVVLALSGCAKEAPPDPTEAARGELRMRLAQACLKNLPAGPVSTHYSDWNEVVEACSSTAYYQSNHCEDAERCLRALADDKP